MTEVSTSVFKRVPMHTIAGPAIALALASFPHPAEAGGGYGTYSGRGYNEAWIVVPGPPGPRDAISPFGLAVRNDAPLGTAANPVPVPCPSLVYRVGRTVIYNAPPAATDAYRIVPSCP